MSGVWSIQSEASTLVLGDVSVKVGAAPGGLLPPVLHTYTPLTFGSGAVYGRARVAPRLLTLDLRSNRRDAALRALRSSLLPYCRPEVGLLTLRYAGSQRTLRLTCYYLDGLDELAPRYLALDPRWSGDVHSGALPGTVTLVGTAGSEPTITLLGGASGGTVSQIDLSNSGYADYFYSLLFNLTVAASKTVTIDVALRTALVTPGGTSALGSLLAGSQLSSFILMPGANDLTITKTGTVTASLGYSARYWSYEDADV